MTVYIERIGAPGIGAKLYPDAAMCAGTRALVDTLDGWSWGGTAPTSGAAVAVGAGPKNYALAEDGWTEDKASALDALTYVGGGVALTGSQRLQLPSGFRPAPGEAHLGWIFWLSHSDPASGVGFNNSLVHSRCGADQFRLTPTYTSGVTTALEFVTRGISSLSLFSAIGTKYRDGSPHQIGLEVERDYVGNLARKSAWFDGALVAQGGWVVPTADWDAPTDGAHIAAVGRSSLLNGSGLNGRFWRALAINLAISGARTMRQAIETDYALNAARVAAANAG